ncbi:MAG: diguanylate cyclase [Campylobacterales bacterium]|nr:diguanylate cyclase [Campylobacterales bacterium]
MYKEALPSHVKFQRIVMGWLAIASLFFREIDLVWLFFAITFFSIFLGTEYSLPTLFYKLFRAVFSRDLVHISEHHVRYYQINTSMDVIDHILRLMASLMALIFYYSGAEIIAWSVVSFLSVFMMLSAYFGFCLSALSYIGLENLRKKFKSDLSAQSSFTCVSSIGGARSHLNENCILAKQCFTPYKRCDSCHITISECLGTKFNSTVIIIGLLLAAFLFVENQTFIQLNILLIMGLIFWLGYQINYTTDELAQSNDANITLNTKLKNHALSLEAEVKRRTADIEYMATHDMLTGLYNRFSFEKILIDAFEGMDAARPSSHLAFIDLDKFKAINDAVGHLAGDRLLCDMSSIFAQSVGQKGSIGRLGGDEFAILFQDVTQQEALNVCQEICEKAGAYDFIWEEQHFSIGASIGLATLDASMQDIKAVMHHADQACYVAKKSGRNQVRLHA